MQASINHYKYNCDPNPTSLLDQEYVDLADSEGDVKVLDYLIAYKKSANSLYLVSCIDNNQKYVLQTQLIQDFVITYINPDYYLVVLENDGSLKFYKIHYNYTFSLEYETVLTIKQPSLYNAVDIGILVADNDQISLIKIKQPIIVQNLKQQCKQILITKNSQNVFILTIDSKLLVLNSKTLQIINEHNLKYTEYDPIKFILHEPANQQLALFTITEHKRIIFWTFQKSDLHTSSLIPTQSIKLKINSNINSLIDFQIDSTQNFIFILYQLPDSSIQIYAALINQAQQPGESIIKHIKEFKKEGSDANMFFQFILPSNLLDRFLHGSNACKSEAEYQSFQSEFKTHQFTEIAFQEEELPYIFALYSQERKRIEFCWFYSDLALQAIHPHNLLELYDTNTSKKKGSSIIKQSQLIPPPYIKEEQPQKVQINEPEQPEIDPIVKAEQIIQNELLPKIQQSQQAQLQLQVISNDVKNELADDPEFIFLIKDLIENEVKKEIDKPGQNDQQALIKLEQQFKQDMQQLEAQMENVIGQNLELYIQTCENFIMDNFCQQYFESLIDDKIDNFFKQQANQELSHNECVSIVQNTTQEFLQDKVAQMYQVELAKMSQAVTQVFDKIVTYFNELQFVEQTKVSNFNQFIESSTQQLQNLSKSIGQLVENYRPGAEVNQKMDQVIQQTESLVKQYDEAKRILQNQQLQPSQPQDQRLSKIEDHILQLRNDLQTLTQRAPVQQQGMDQFIKGMAGQLTQMQIRLTQPQMTLVQIQELLNQLILQFQYFILKFGS